MSGARNYLALVVMFPEGTEAQLALGGLEPREIHFREVVVDVAAVGRSTDEVLRIMTEHMEPEEHPKPRKAAIDQRLGDLKRLGQDVTGERLRKHGERIAELESSVRDLEVGRGPHQVAREEFGGLSMHVDQLARSLAAVEEKLERLSFAPTSFVVTSKELEKEAEGLGAHPPCGTFSAQALLARRETFGAMLRRTRLTAGLSLRDMAEHMGFQVSSVSDAERNDRRLTDAELERWAEAIGHDVEDLEPVAFQPPGTEGYVPLTPEAPGATPAPGPAEPSQAPAVERESGSWIETTADGTKPWPEEWGAPPLPCMLVVRAGSQLAGVVALRDRRFRDAYVAGFARCRELDPRGRDTAAYKAEDLAGERAAQHVVEDLQGLSSGGVFAFLTAAREAIRAKRAGEGS